MSKTAATKSLSFILVLPLAIALSAASYAVPDDAKKTRKVLEDMVS